MAQIEQCGHCLKVIVFDQSVPNEVTGSPGYWRDVVDQDTACGRSPDNGHGQFLHRPLRELQEIAEAGMAEAQAKTTASLDSAVEAGLKAAEMLAGSGTDPEKLAALREHFAGLEQEPIQQAKEDDPYDGLEVREVWAISAHSGGGSMSEGFDSQGAIGFWSTYDEADKVARYVYKKIAAVDSYFRDEWDVRPVQVQMIVNPRDQQAVADALAAALVKDW